MVFTECFPLSLDCLSMHAALACPGEEEGPTRHHVGDVVIRVSGRSAKYISICIPELVEQEEIDPPRSAERMFLQSPVEHAIYFHELL